MLISNVKLKKAVYILCNYNYEKEKETRRKNQSVNKEWLLLNRETVSDHFLSLHFLIFSELSKMTMY